MTTICFVRSKLFDCVMLAKDQPYTSYAQASAFVRHCLPVCSEGEELNPERWIPADILEDYVLPVALLHGVALSINPSPIVQ